MEEVCFYETEKDVNPSFKSTKKRKISGRVSDVTKRLRAATHETGNSCECKRLNCFNTISVNEQKILIKEFNLLGDRNKQYLHLSALVEVKDVSRHRPRKENSAIPKLNDYSYSYKVRLMREGKLHEIPVCYKAFLSLHGITNQMMITIKKSLTSTGSAPVDKRGLHKNRVHKKDGATLNKVHEHLQSLKGRKSHYSLKKTNKIYMSEDLNVKKLHRMYTNLYPEFPVSYEYYRKIFTSEYNIGFGYPRKDSCSFCDELKVKLLALQSKSNDQASEKEIKDLSIKRELHLRKADYFYKKKKCAKLLARKSLKSGSEYGAICVDFMKNLPCPNISTNDVYYRRQLSLFMFNVHSLSNADAIFYVYDETIAKKGADDVCSMLHHFFYNIFDMNTKRLTIFLDSSAGQNKNYTMFRFLHHLCVKEKRFDAINMVFPIRGHSYMEPDRNMGVINQKVSLETPSQWSEHIAEARQNPMPFKVYQCDQTMFKSWTNFLKPMYKKKAPFMSRAIREIKFSSEESTKVFLRTNYNSQWEPFEVVDDKCSAQSGTLGQSYNNLLPLSLAKFKDIQHLKTFCSSDAQKYFSSLPVQRS